MKKWMVVAAAALLGANLAQAQVTVCDRSVMQDRRIPAENRRGLEAACRKNSTFTHCQALADERKLLGDAKAKFMQKCAGLAPLPPTGPGGPARAH